MAFIKINSILKKRGQNEVRIIPAAVNGARIKVLVGSCAHCAKLRNNVVAAMKQANIPGTVLFALVGAIITERVYVVPGAGNLLTTAINMYDNNVIVGLTLFYALLSVVAIILGDLLMTLVDPRISFVQKAR